MSNQINTRQSQNVASLSAIGSAAGATVDVILADINNVFAAATSSPTASVIMKRDVNANTSANSFIANYVSTVTAAGTTTLTVASAFIQIFTGTMIQTVALPAADTMVLGQQFYISNESTGVVTVDANTVDGSGSVIAMAANTHALVTVTNIGVGTGTWDVNYTSNTALINPMTAAGQMIYGGVSGTPTALPAGTTGQILKSNGAAAPTWVAPSTIYLPPQISYFYSSSSSPYVTPAGALYLKIRMVGGGGGGGGSSDSTAGNGAGGGAGGYLEVQITPTPLQSFAFSVGTGGTGGNNSNGGQNGTAGVSSTFAGGSYIAPGGGGGGSSLGANNIQAPVGLGGAPSSGDFNVTGGNGSSGSVSTSGNLADALGGNGGSSFFGGGGIGGVNGGISPTDGQAYGSGGGGGGQKAGAQAGADGAPGAIIVEAHFQ